jgi:hypothetical protein
MRRFLLLPFFAAVLFGADRGPVGITAREIASPAPNGATGASLVTAPDGRVWLSWVEPDRAGNRLRFATLDAATKKWSAPHAIATGHGVPTSTSDFPQVAVAAKGEAVAVWTDGAGGARFTATHDHGLTWSSPRSWTSEGRDVENFSLVTLADGRVLAAWLDGRNPDPTRKAQSLYARIVGQSGPDVLVDNSVCDCCPTTLTAFLDGTALVAYRGRTPDEVRDIRVARFRGTAWEQPRTLNRDGWRINGCPVNGPQLASDGGRVAAAWFTAAEDRPRVLASFSSDAGRQFLLPLELSRAKPAGQVDTVLLHDGAMLATWVEADGSLSLGRISPDYAADEPFSLAAGSNGRVQGTPRSALVRDYAGGKSAAEFLVAFTRAAGPSTALRMLLVTVPEGELLEAEKSCDCAPTAEQLQGYPIGGTITAAQPDGALRVKHGEVPGVLAAGVRDFHVAPGTATAVQPGRQFLGRIERRDGDWWLFDVRLIAMAP